MVKVEIVSCFNLKVSQIHNRAAAVVSSGTDYPFRCWLIGSVHQSSLVSFADPERVSSFVTRGVEFAELSAIPLESAPSSKSF